MKAASKEFKEKMNTGGSFYQTGKIVFADGTERELGRKDFYMSGNTYSDGPGASSFPLGEAMAKNITVSLVNDDDRFSDVDFYMAKITVYLNCDLADSTESILLGTFTVTTPEAYGTQVAVEALDDMYKGDREYTTTISFPTTLQQMLIDSCQTCGVVLLTTAFDNDSFVVSKKPESITHRQLWGMIAMIAGGNARMDENNRLKIVGYDFSCIETTAVNGGVFDDNTPYASGDTADGGNFTDYTSGVVLDGGTFLEMKKYHFFHQTKTPTIATDDVVITGVKATIEDVVHLSGAEGYVINIDNQLITDNPDTALALIGSKIIGLKFRPFTIDHTAYPLAEFGDMCYVIDRKGNVYQSVVTDVNFTYFGFTTISCRADDPLRNSSKYYSSSTEAVVKAKQDTKNQLSAYDLAVQQLVSLVTQSFGVFKTEKKQDDDSIIYFLHNKPELSSSSTIWKMTADAFAVSTDGGETWNAGMDSEGNAVLNVLSAIGIKFDWAKGGTLTLGGADNADGVLEVYNAEGAEVCRITKDGMKAVNAVIQASKYVAEGRAVKNASDYTEEDSTYLKNVILGLVSPTIADFEKYDFDGDGRLDLQDYVKIRRLLEGYQDSYVLDTSVKIDPGNALSLIKTNEVSIGTKGMYSPFLTVVNLQIGNASENSKVLVFDKKSGQYVSAVEDDTYYVSGYGIRTSGGIITAIHDATIHFSTNNGEYYKYPDGTLVCTKKVYVSTSCSNAWGTLYDSPEISLGEWAYPFVSTPTVSLNYVPESSYAMIEGNGGVSETSAGMTYLCRPTATTTTGYIHVTGIGRWK